jgi:DNA-binding MurR/RpiR family transcriptional regulator
VEISYQMASGPEAVVAPAGVLARLGSLIASLRESERKIGEYLQANAGEVVYLSITELADRTGTSEATVIRFARQLGFSGYAALKIALALDLHAAAPRSAGPARNGPIDFGLGSDAASIKQGVIQLSIESLNDTAMMLDTGELERAIQAILAARRVEIYGVGSSGIVAQNAYLQLMQIGVPAVAVTDPHVQLMAATQLGAGDVALAISQAGSTRDTVEALQLASEAGATCICITRHARSPITQVAHITLLAASRPVTVGGLPVFGDVAQYAIVDMLAAAAASRRESSAAVLASGRQAISSRRF